MRLKMGNSLKNLRCIVLSPTAVSTLAKFTKCHMKHRTTWCVYQRLIGATIVNRIRCWILTL